MCKSGENLDQCWTGGEVRKHPEGVVLLQMLRCFKVTLQQRASSAAPELSHQNYPSPSRNSRQQYAGVPGIKVSTSGLNSRPNSELKNVIYTWVQFATVTLLEAVEL
jgi:hypothetical protein